MTYGDLRLENKVDRVMLQNASKRVLITTKIIPETGGKLYENSFIDAEEPANGTHKTEDITVEKLQGAISLDHKSFERAVCVYHQAL